MASKKYFGTDGVRGKAGEPPMTADFATRLARAASRALVPPGGTVIIGKDTRASGPLFEAALEAGFVSMGVTVKQIGVLPTPAVAFLVRRLKCDLGVIVSASHNAYEDNGIKFFDKDGGKLSDETEEQIESFLDAEPGGSAGTVEDIGPMRAEYERFAAGTAPRPDVLSGLKIVVDAANGAGYEVAPRILETLGATVIPVAVHPDGKNINDGCGATAPGLMQKAVRDAQADAGIALDGDGDRLIMADHEGSVVDGDRLVFLLAKAYKSRGMLKGPVVGTVLSNIGTELALKKEGIGFERAQVGDKSVLEMLRKHGGVLGGEPSGHLILLDKVTTGDGIIAAVQVLSLMAEEKKTLKELSAGVTLFPQVAAAIPLRRKMAAEDVPGLLEAAERIRSESSGSVRVVVRPSGTEPVMRIMVEHERKEAAEAYVRELSALVSAAV